jgi:hypothetical protein
MTSSNDIISWVVMGAILLLIFAGCGFIIKRFFIDKKYYGGAQFVGRQIYEKFQNADGKKSIEHVIKMEQEDHHEDFIDETDDSAPKIDASNKAME